MILENCQFPLIPGTTLLLGKGSKEIMKILNGIRHEGGGVLTFFAVI